MKYFMRYYRIYRARNSVLLAAFKALRECLQPLPF